MRLEGDSTPKPPAVARYSAWTGPLVESTLSSSGPSLCQVFRIQRPSASQKRRRNRKNARRGRSGGRENALAEALSCAGQANWNLWGSGLPPPPRAWPQGAEAEGGAEAQGLGGVGGWGMKTRGPGRPAGLPKVGGGAVLVRPTQGITTPSPAEKGAFRRVSSPRTRGSAHDLTQHK